MREQTGLRVVPRNGPGRCTNHAVRSRRNKKCGHGREGCLPKLSASSGRSRERYPACSAASLADTRGAETHRPNDLRDPCGGHLRAASAAWNETEGGQACRHLRRKPHAHSPRAGPFGQQGYIDLRPNPGAVIASPTAEEAVQVFEAPRRGPGDRRECYRAVSLVTRHLNTIEQRLNLAERAMPAATFANSSGMKERPSPRERECSAPRASPHSDDIALHARRVKRRPRIGPA